MNVSGRHTLTASRAAVFAAICDPGELLQVIPGCQEIRRIGDAEYRGRVSIRLPAIVGVYETSVRLVESDAPSFGRLEGRLDGAVGSIAGEASFRLTEMGTRRSSSTRAKPRSAARWRGSTRGSSRAWPGR